MSEVVQGESRKLCLEMIKTHGGPPFHFHETQQNFGGSGGHLDQQGGAGADPRARWVSSNFGSGGKGGTGWNLAQQGHPRTGDS